MADKIQPINLRAQREAVNIYYVYHFPIFVFLIQVTGLFFIAIVYLLIKLYLNDYSYMLATPEQTRNFHMILAPLGFVFITGEGILIFRICRNIKTWQVKICHIFLHGLATVIGAFAIFCMYYGKMKGIEPKAPLTDYQKKRIANNSISGYSTHDLINYDAPHMYTFHPGLGYFSAACVVTELATGVALMLVDANSFYIDMISELHGFLGVFTLITTSITASVGIMTKMNDPVYFDMQRYYDFADEYKLAFGGVSGCLIFTWGIIYVVINPHFEWVKIGPL